MKPRKLKKAVKLWINNPEYQLRGDYRRRVLRMMNRYRRLERLMPIRRLPDGRVSILELP